MTGAHTKKTKELTLQSLSASVLMFEKELLSIIWTNPQMAIRANIHVKQSDFRTLGAHFEVLVDCAMNNKSVSHEFHIKGLQFSDFVDVPSIRVVEDVCRDLVEAANSFRLFAVLESAAAAVPSTGTRSFASDVQKAVIQSISTADRESVGISGLIAEYRKRQQFYIEKQKAGNPLVGISTGYDKLDEVIDGLRPEHLWVIGGYTSMGKTFAAINLIASLVKQGKRVVFYSLEMSEVDILSRLIGVMVNYSGLSIMKGFSHDEKKVADALEQIRNSDFCVHSDLFEVSEIQFSMYEENLKRPVDLFVVDFMQLIRVKGSEREYETLTVASTTLQQAAKTLKAPVIVLSQISNESAKSSDPVVMGFKGSGSIAAAADLAIEIQIGEDKKEDWKTKLHNGEEVKMKWNIRKNRHGRTGYIDMLFLGKTGVFRLDNEVDEFAAEAKNESMGFGDDVDPTKIDF